MQKWSELLNLSLELGEASGLQILAQFAEPEAALQLCSEAGDWDRAFGLCFFFFSSLGASKDGVNNFWWVFCVQIF